jgi:hypothetical protein
LNCVSQTSSGSKAVIVSSSSTAGGCAAFAANARRARSAAAPSSPRARCYERLKRYAEHLRGTLFDRPDLHKAVDALYQRPLKVEAAETLGRQLKAGVDDDTLAELVIALHEEGNLCITPSEAEHREPQIICSLGLV